MSRNEVKRVSDEVAGVERLLERIPRVAGRRVA